MSNACSSNQINFLPKFVFMKNLALAKLHSYIIRNCFRFCGFNMLMLPLNKGSLVYKQLNKI